jgi:predicted TPR repeat methyltransferase
MPNKAVRQMYQHFAPTFESNLIGELNYRGPEGVQQIIDPLLGDRRQLAILDLGCGSGLAGERFKPLAESLVGVDISPEMLALARARDIYDRLEVAEVTEWLGRSTETFDLIVSCECLIYFGDLRQVVIPAAKRLLAGGILAFTLERGDRYPFRLTDSGRYAHDAKHVSEVAAEAGLIVKSLDEGFLRKEYGADVTGLFVALSHCA